MKIAIASGKGGTGKTLVSTNLFNVINDAMYVDCDVEEPNGHLFLKHNVEKKVAVTIPIPSVDNTKCNYCGRCVEVCQFNALIVAKEKVIVFPELCHGCGSCSYFCPQKAISEKSRNIGEIKEGTFHSKKVITGQLNIGEPMAPPIIRKIKKIIHNQTKFVIIDCPPGTSCSVIESLKETDFIVLVTEPTPFGLNDLKLAVEVVRKLQLPFGIVVNKSGFASNLITNYCQEESIKILLEINHDNTIASMYSKGELITNKQKYRIMFQRLYQKILKEVLT